jgi:hypothetical protein
MDGCYTGEVPKIISYLFLISRLKGLKNKEKQRFFEKRLYIRGHKWHLAQEGRFNKGEDSWSS